MRNIYLFLLRNSVLILFLVLQAIALYTLFNFNRFHESVLNMFASEVSGSVYRQTDRVEAYLTLQSENDKLRDHDAFRPLTSRYCLAGQG
jgi:rod shape-determining protein MreC